MLAFLDFCHAIHASSKYFLFCIGDSVFSIFMTTICFQDITLEEAETITLTILKQVIEEKVSYSYSWLHSDFGAIIFIQVVP